MAPNSTVPVTAPVKDTWLRPVEQLVLPALQNRVRILGFSAPESGAGVTTLCKAAADVLARSGARVLMLDLSSAVSDDRNGRSWSLGHGDAVDAITSTPEGYDILRAAITPETRFLFNNATSLRSTLDNELSGYGAIIVDLPPLLDTRTQSINPIASALICDEVVLVCAHGVTTRTSAREATEAARTAGIRISGAVWNRRGASTVGDEMGRTARRWLCFIPPLARSLERRFKRTPLLND